MNNLERISSSSHAQELYRKWFVPLRQYFMSMDYIEPDKVADDVIRDVLNHLRREKSQAFQRSDYSWNYPQTTLGMLQEYIEVFQLGAEVFDKTMSESIPQRYEKPSWNEIVQDLWQTLRAKLAERRAVEELRKTTRKRQ